MKLIPKSIKVPSLGETENIKDPIAVIKLFHPFGSWSWYVLEYSPEENLCFGLVDGHEVELGYFSLAELKELRVRGLPVERDLWFEPMKLSVLQDKLNNKSV